LQTLRQPVEDVGSLVHPTALLALRLSGVCRRARRPGIPSTDRGSSGVD
jgi:hypothetical protein